MIEIAEKQAAGPVIRLHPRDNVIIARTDIAIGTKVASENLMVRGQVPAGHKIAARAIKAGEPVMKYNVCIGFAAADLQGIVREDGQVGTRNFIGILPTVNCSATAVHRIVDFFDEKFLKGKYPNMGGVVG